MQHFINSQLSFLSRFAFKRKISKLFRFAFFFNFKIEITNLPVFLASSSLTFGLDDHIAYTDKEEDGHN